MGIGESSGQFSESGPRPSARYAWREKDRVRQPKRGAQSRVTDFHEIYSLFDAQTIREQAERCVQCAEPTCVEGCPLGNRIPEWVGLAAEGRFLEAAELSRQTSSMPEICPRVCPQERLCEGNCIIHTHEGLEPVCVGAIEKFINEYALAHGRGRVETAPPTGRRVAVVGSGPGGLACADRLSQLGHGVTVFESQMLPGGLLLFGIPAFKLEKEIVSRRVNLLKMQGVEFRTGVVVGTDLSLAQLRKDFDAVFLGIGALKPKGLRVPGADLQGVIQGLPFLAQKNAPVSLGIDPVNVEAKRVVVLGGGDSAMDCLRTALRCGAADTVCVYRRDFDNMPGSRKEYENATEEGARFLFLTNPVEVLGDARGRVRAVRCIRMELGEPDVSGRRRPIEVPDSEHEIPADLVLVAYGFDPVPFPPENDLSSLEVNDWGATRVDEDQRTSIEGVFAGGDVVRGPSLVVHAVRDGRRAAEAIDRYLCGKGA